MIQKSVRFTDFIKQDNILCKIPGRDRDTVLAQLITLLHSNIGGFNQQEALQAIIEREKVAPTVISKGIALPHARIEPMDKPVVAIGTSLEGIDFETADGDIVNVIILVLTPKSDPSAYLKLVATLSKELSEPAAPKRLASCETPKEVIEVLTSGIASLPAHLTARDVMIARPVTLKESDTLGYAIETICAKKISLVPVIDEEEDVRGVIALEDLLKLCLPEHLLWMHDLSPIMNFQPFAELLRNDQSTKVADFLSQDYIAVGPDTPAIQLAKIFLKDEVRQILITEGSHLLGIVSLSRFTSQIFWE